jgi:hypothetical protein
MYWDCEIVFARHGQAKTYSIRDKFLKAASEIDARRQMQERADERISITKDSDPNLHVKTINVRFVCQAYQGW